MDDDEEEEEEEEDERNRETKQRNRDIIYTTCQLRFAPGARLAVRHVRHSGCPSTDGD